MSPREAAAAAMTQPTARTASPAEASSHSSGSASTHVPALRLGAVGIGQTRAAAALITGNGRQQALPPRSAPPPASQDPDTGPGRKRPAATCSGLAAFTGVQRQSRSHRTAY